MAKERSDLLRRRPKQLRYFFLAVSDDGSLHVGTSYGSLDLTLRTTGVNDLYVADVVSGQVIHVEESIPSFMYRWANHYNDLHWDYADEVRGEKDARVSE